MHRYVGLTLILVDIGLVERYLLANKMRFTGIGGRHLPVVIKGTQHGKTRLKSLNF